MFHALTQTDDDLAPLLARLTAGIVMFPHGAQKALGWFGGGGFSATLDSMTSGGIPWIVALLVILGEFLGSIGLVVGALSRIAAFGFVVIMIGAIVMFHGEHGFFMNWFGNQAGHGYEYHLLMIGLALIVLIKGSGAFSIDRKLA